VLRGDRPLSLDLTIAERPEALDHIADVLDPDKTLVRQLGILGVSIDQAAGWAVASLRAPAGVMVAAHAVNPTGAAVSLLPGDVIHSVNNRSVSNLDELRAALDGLQPHASVVLQIEREGLFTFLAFEVD
jgi:S1-C subfamily serine protease